MPTNNERDAIYDMIDAVRRIKDEGQREKTLIYFTGYANGLASMIHEQGKGNTNGKRS